MKGKGKVGQGRERHQERRELTCVRVQRKKWVVCVQKMVAFYPERKV